MLLLLSGATRDVMRLREHPNIGVLTSPRRAESPDYIKRTGLSWGMDNDAFSDGGFKPDKFMDRLYQLRDVPGCLFVCLPDAVGDAATTITKFFEWSAWVKYLGYPVALVGQDGLEDLTIPWSMFDAFFIGGSTQWKLSKTAASIVAEAKKLGKWVHMGRVNSVPRIRYAQRIGCDSVDGSGYSINQSHIYRHLPAFETTQHALPGIFSD